MGLIKHFNERNFRMKDPNNPAKHILGKQLVPSGTAVVAHEGIQYESDAEGWFEVPAEVEAFLCRFPGWKNEAEVSEEILAGFMEAEHALPSPKERAAMPPPKRVGTKPAKYKTPPPAKRVRGRQGVGTDGAKRAPVNK